MTIQIVQNNEFQFSWYQEPSEYAAGVTLSHGLNYRKTHRVEEYTGTSDALINAGLCTEEQLPPENSVMRTYTPDGKRKKTGQPVEAGTLQIVRVGRRLFRCNRLLDLTTQEKDYIKAENEREFQRTMTEIQERERKDLSSKRRATYYEIMVAVFDELSDERIEVRFNSALSEFLDTKKAMLFVKEQRRRKVAENDGNVIYPKAWKRT